MLGCTMTAMANIKETSLLEDLIGHAVKSLYAAEHFSGPFPHIFFRDFFPADFYQKLICSYPTEAAYQKVNGTGTRTALRLYGEHIAGIDAGVRDMWAAVSAMLVSPEVEQAIREKLADGLEIRRIGDKVAAVDDLKLVAMPVLYKDVDGYEIKPHPDTRKKVATMQLYCPSDETQAEMGTTLYQASMKGLLNPKSYFLEP